MEYLLVAFLQLCFSVFKVFEIKWSYEKQMLKLTLISFLQSFTWITSTAIGVGGVLDGDVWMAVLYVVFGGLGKILAIKVFNEDKYFNKKN